MSKKLIVPKTLCRRGHQVEALGILLNLTIISERRLISSHRCRLPGNYAALKSLEVKRGKWSFAHLPVIPPHFSLSPIENGLALKSAHQTSSSAKMSDSLINGCDAGREGEFDLQLYCTAY